MPLVASNETLSETAPVEYATMYFRSLTPVIMSAFAASLLLPSPAHADSVTVTFQDTIGNTVISDKFTVNDVNFMTSRTTFVAPGYTDSLVFSLTVIPNKEMQITYSGTVGNTAGTNVWTITGPSNGSAIATS